MKLAAVKALVTSKVGRQVLIVRKHSPILLFGAGVVGVVATVVLASRATLKLDEILDETNADLDRVRSAEHEDYSDADRQRDLGLVYAKTAGKITKIYAPAVAVGLLSIAALTGSHVILTKRNVAITAAYAALDRGWREYRARVAKEFGPEKEQELRHGLSDRKIVKETPEGPVTKNEKLRMKGEPSVYAFFFDQLCPDWSKDPGYNRVFLSCQQNYLNDLLKSRGHVLLNDMHDALGVARTPAGAVAGWIYDPNRDQKTNPGDNYISFGIFDNNADEGMRWVLGHNDGVLIDPNVDGLIWTLI